MAIQRIGLFLAAYATFGFAGRVLPADDPSLESALRIIEQAVTDQEIPGASVLVMRDGHPIASRAYGKCELEANRPFRTDTICWTASLTKPVTAAAAMSLVDQGRLQLDDPVDKYLPYFRKQTASDGHHRSITVRQLMCHGSGIQTAVPLRPRFFFEQPWYRRSVSEVAEAIAETELVFEPGARAQYSNAAPYVLGRIIEVQSQQTFGDYVREKILEPLQMTDTGFAVPRDKAGRTAVVYRRQDGSLVEYCRYDPNWVVRMTMPDGGIFSTPRDMARFADSFLDGQRRLLSKAAVDQMLTEQLGGFGLGWILDAEGQFSHWGSSGTLVWGDRKTHVIGVVFFQIQDRKRVDAIQRRFRDAVTQATRVAR